MLYYVQYTLYDVHCNPYYFALFWIEVFKFGSYQPLTLFFFDSWVIQIYSWKIVIIDEARRPKPVEKLLLNS